MTRKEFFCKRIVRLNVLVLVSFIFLMLKPYLGNAYEKEIVLGEVYQTKKEKEALKDRFRLDLSFGYGYSYAQILTGVYGPSPEFQEYLDRLDMKFSENDAVLRLTATYAITPKMGIYLAVPSGVFTIKKEKPGTIARLFEEGDLGFGVGDIYGGIYYNLLSGSKSTPNILV